PAAAVGHTTKVAPVSRAAYRLPLELDSGHLSWLFMPHKEKSVLADRQIPAINHFFVDKEAVFVFKIHQIRFSVPNLIECGSLLRFALHVCKLRIVVDGLDVKRLLIRLEAVAGANLGKELAELAVQRALKIGRAAGGERDEGG